MAGNTIQITFNQDLLNGSILRLTGTYNNGTSITPLDPDWIWITTRNAAYRVTTGTPTATVGERAAMNFLTAFNLDYNGTGIHQVTRTANVVNIVSPTQYTWETGLATRRNGDFTDLLLVYFVFGNDNAQLPFLITNIEYLPYSFDRCRKVRVKVTTNVEMSAILQPVTESGINSTTYTFNYPRGTNGNISLTSNQTTPLNAIQGFQTPSLLSADNQVETVNNSPNGATLIFNSVNQTGLVLTYAIVPPDTSPVSDDYQESNVFSGIPAGDYWIYFKDQFGCTKYKALTVAEFGGSRVPFFFISKSMSFRFANRIDFSDAGNYKNDENTLSCEADVVLPYMEIQQFQTADIITTQFKSNYSINLATIIRQNGQEVSVPVIQKSNNIGVKDKRDAIQVSVDGGKLGFYFQAGNTYDYDTDVDTGDYALNGTLPYWATIGNYFQIAGVWYQITEIFYDNDLYADIIIVDNTYTGPALNVIVGSIFNLFNYEVYEFVIDLVDYQGEDIQVRIDSIDEDFGSLEHLSEFINVKVKQPGTVEIKYRNPENTDVFYSTGISNTIRQLLTAAAAIPIETSENYKTDSTTVLLRAEVYEGTQFTFEPVTAEIMRKMVEAFNHKDLQINGVYYVKNGECEVEGPLGVTNIYVVKANLIKTAGAFNNNIGGSDNEIFDVSNIEIPGILDIGDGTYIRYQ